MRPKTKAKVYELTAAICAIATMRLLDIHTVKTIVVFWIGAVVVYYCASAEAQILTEDRYADVKAYLKKEGYI